MPVVLPTPMHMTERFDYLPWAAAAFADLPLGEEGGDCCMSFDHISNVLSRCATPPPESLPPSPLDSAMTSPSQSRCPSPAPEDMLLDLLLQYDDSASSGQSSLNSTPYSSSPASPMNNNNNTITNTFAGNYFTYDLSAVQHNANTVASLKQARRAHKNGEAKPMKVKKIAKADKSSSSVVLVNNNNSYAATVIPTSEMMFFGNDDVSVTTTTSSSKGPSKRSKAVALASKRDSHNISERNRRQELKLSFNQLQNMVPNLINASRAHTGTVLKETIAYIHALQQEEDRLIAAKAALYHQRAMLLSSISA